MPGFQVSIEERRLPSAPNVAVADTLLTKIKKIKGRKLQHNKKLYMTIIGVRNGRSIRQGAHSTLHQSKSHTTKKKKRKEVVRNKSETIYKKRIS